MIEPSTQESAPIPEGRGALALSDTRHVTTISDRTAGQTSHAGGSQTAEGSTSDTSTNRETTNQQQTTESTYRDHRATPSTTRKQEQDRQQNRAHTYAWRVANRFWRAAGAARSDRTGVGR